MMFNIPIEIPTIKGKGFGRKGWVGFRMLWAIVINKTILTAAIGNAAYLHILLHVLKNFHLSRALISETPKITRKTFWSFKSCLHSKTTYHLAVTSKIPAKIEIPPIKIKYQKRTPSNGVATLNSIAFV
jgi:hypothetical protein